MAIEVNGVTLPDIPADVLAQYPYAVVTSGEDYMALVSTEVCLFVDVDGGIVSTLGDSVALLLHEGAWINMGATMTIQVSQTPLIWANHDVEIVVDENDDGTIITEGIYFARNDTDSGGSGGDDSESTDYSDRYSVPSTWLSDMADETRRLTETTAQMDTDTMLALLAGLELSSGGSGDSGEGGSGSGGDSGDDSGGGSSVTYPDVSNEYLGYSGNAEGTVEIPTGYVTYMYKRFKMWPSTYRYQHAYCDRAGTYIECYQSTAPILIESSSSLKITHTAPCNVVVYQYDLAITGLWTEAQKGISTDLVYTVPRSATFTYANHDIYYEDTGAISKRKSDDPVAETIQGTVLVADTYTANGADLNSVALVAKKITGNDNPMTFTQAVWALEDYAASLE